MMTPAQFLEYLYIFNVYFGGEIPPTAGALLRVNNLSDLSNVTTARANLGLGTMALQNASAVAVTGGAVNGTTIGATTPAAGHFSTLASPSVSITGGTIDSVTIDNADIGTIIPATGVFSNLSAPVRLSLISSNTTVSPSNDLSRVFQVDTAGVIISADPYASYQNAFEFGIKNTSTGNINFTPNAPDTIEGMATLIIGANEAYTIVKSLYSGKWFALNNYNTGTAGGYLLAANNLSDVLSAATSRTNLGLGTIATQDFSNVDIEGGVIKSTPISPSILNQAFGGFNPLVWFWRTINKSADYTLHPENDLSDIVYVDTAGVAIKTSTFLNYNTTYHVLIKNISSGDINFTPFPGDFIENASTLVIPKNTSVWITKGSTQWYILVNYNSETGTFGTMAYQNANAVDISGGNISGTWLGLGLATYFVSSTTDVTLTNPCPGVVSINMTTTGKKLILPPANVANSITSYGGRIEVNNKAAEELYAFDVYDANGSLVFSDLVGGKSVTLYATSNGTLGGTWSVSAELGTLSQQNAGNVLITGGSINNTQIGTNPFGYAIGVFNPLAWYWRTDQISASFTLDPITNLSDIEYVNTAGVVVSAQTIANYGEAYHVIIKNISSGDINFTPFTGEFVEGLSTLIIPAGTSAWIAKNQTEWRLIANYNSGTAGGYLLAANNLSDVLSASTSRTNLGLGTIATQDFSNVDIEGGVIKSTPISPSILNYAFGGFSPLVWFWRTVTKSADYTLHPENDLSDIVYVNTAGVVIKTSTFLDYNTTYHVLIKNISSGDINFTPFLGDLIEGSPTLVIPKNTSVWITKGATEWYILVNYNSETGSFGTMAYQNANAVDISGGNIRNTWLGLGLAEYFVSSTTNVTLTNPCPAVVSINMTTLGKKLILPAANANNSISSYGGRVVVNNVAAEEVFPFDIYDASGSLVYANLYGGKSITLYATSNSTLAGTWSLSAEIGSLSQQNASSVAIGGGSMDNTAIGSTTASTAVFSSLKAPVNLALTSTNTVVSTTVDLNTIFQVNTSGVIISTTAYAGYPNGFEFGIKNVSSGNINFTPASPDTVEGLATLVISPNEGYSFAKSLVSGKWIAINNYNTGSAGGYLLAANNLSDVANKYTANTNLGNPGAPVDISSAVDYTSSNPCPALFNAVFTAANKKIILPAMNTTGSIGKGATIGFYNNGAIPFSVVANDGSTVLIAALPPYVLVQLVLSDNSTANGTFDSAGTFNGDRIINKNVSTTPYIPDPTIDFGLNFVCLDFVNINLLAGTNYKDGYWFSAINQTSNQVVNINPLTGEYIDNQIYIQLNPQDSAVIYRANSTWNIKANKVGITPSGLIAVTSGGLERSSLTAHGVVIGAGSSPVNVTAYGPIGYVFTGNGSAADPTFQDISTLQVTSTPYIVGADHANYTSINAAITQAVVDGASLSSPKVILLKPGTYTEDVTLYTGIILLALDKLAWNGLYYQSLISQVLSTKIVGKITYNTSAVNANTYASIQNIWIAPPTDDVITYTGQLSAGYTQLLYLDSCRLDITAANKYAFNLTNCDLNHNNCFINDNTSGTTGHYYTCAGDSNTVYITSTTSFIFTDLGASPTALPANAAPSVRMINCVTTASIDASSALTYNFRAQGTTHALVGATNLTPYHKTGASTTGRIVYDNCNVTMNDVAINVTTIASSAFITEFNNTNFGDLFAPSSDLFSGGRQIFTNCGFQTATDTYYVRNDLIKVGFSGSSKINKQAAATTSNATPTLLDSVLLNQGESVIVTGTVIAQKSDSSDACGAYFSITARRASGGNITLVGSPVIDPNTSSSATVTVDVDTSTQSVRIIVTGIAATTYYWGTDYSYQKMLTSA